MRTTFIAILLAHTSIAQAGNLLVNPGFETPEGTGGGFPTSTGHWNGDLSEIVIEENGIMPADGIRMLHFIGTGPFGGSPDAEASQVSQLYSGPEVQPGSTLFASAHFNRISDIGIPLIDTFFRVTMTAHSGSPSTYSPNVFLAQSTGSIISDNDPLTWEFADTSLLLPVGTTYVAVELAASENVFNDPSLPEFHGHYADAVTLAVVPEPGTALLLGIAGLAVSRRRR